jgi:uncharacterized membrane protein
MSYRVAYLGALLVFGVLDLSWLSVMGPRLYRPALSEILLANLRIAPAVVFYLAYPIGIAAFAAAPALRNGSPQTAFFSGLLFGAIAYGTYDLTNLATLRNWTLQITVVDIVYGALVSAVAAIAAYALVWATLGIPATS